LKFLVIEIINFVNTSIGVSLVRVSHRYTQMGSNE